MAKVNYSLSTKKTKNDKTEVLIRFVYGSGKAIRAKSGVFVYTQYWSKKKQVVNIPTLEKKEIINDCKTVNKLLTRLSNCIINAYADNPDTVSKEWLSDIIENTVHPNRCTSTVPVWTNYFDIFINNRKVSTSRHRRYLVLKRTLQRYELYKGNQIDFSLWTEENLKDFQTYLKDEHIIIIERPGIWETIPESRRPVERGENTLACLFSCLRSFIKWYNDNGYISNEPFNKFDMPKEQYGTPYYITTDERNQIYNFDFTNNRNIEIQRDIFIFQCVIGCRVSDLYNLTKDSVKGDFIEYIPQKTSKERETLVRVPINNIGLAILNKYADYTGKGLLPFISMQNYNYAIKEIFTRVGITRKVLILDSITREITNTPINEIASSHLARRCFIGNLYAKVKDPNLIGSMSGHKEGSRAFVRYRDISDEVKKDVIKLID